MEPTKSGDRVIALHPDGQMKRGEVQAFTQGQLPDGTFGTLVVVAFDYEPALEATTANVPAKSVMLDQ